MQCCHAATNLMQRPAVDTLIGRGLVVVDVINVVVVVVLLFFLRFLSRRRFFRPILLADTE